MKLVSNVILLGCFLFQSAAADCSQQRGATPVNLKNETFNELSMFAENDRGILAVRCVKVETVNAGSRSERVILHVEIVAGDSDRFTKPFTLTRFSQKDPIMKTGVTYLVAVYRGEWAPAWSLIESIQVDPKVVKETVTKNLERLKQNQRPAQ
jgi:hypothetical protein